MNRLPITPAAIHAYAHAARMQRVEPHGLDVVDGVLTVRRSSRYRRPPSRPIDHDRGGTISHRVGAPTATAFKLGVGFTAGVLSVRGLVALVVGTALLLGAVRLLDLVSG